MEKFYAYALSYLQLIFAIVPDDFSFFVKKVWGSQAPAYDYKFRRYLIIKYLVSVYVPYTPTLQCVQTN